jgi:hypothetical protein
MGNEELVEEIKLQYIKFALHENNEDAAICALLRTELLRRLEIGERAVAAMEKIKNIMVFYKDEIRQQKIERKLYE